MKPPPRADFVHEAIHLGFDLGGRGALQPALNIDRPVQGDFAAEIGLQLVGIHAGGLGLDGLQGVHAAVDESRKQSPAGPAAVVRHLGAVRVNQVEQFLLLGGEESIEAGRRDQRPALAAEIVAAMHQVDSPLGGVQDALDVSQIEAVPSLHNVEIDGVFHGDVQQHLLDAAAKRHAVDEVLDVRSARGDGQIGMLRAQRRQGGVIEPVRIGPRPLFRLFHRGPRRVGQLDRLGVLAVLVGHGPPADAPEVRRRAVVEAWQRRAKVRRADVADVSPQPLGDAAVFQGAGAAAQRPAHAAAVRPSQSAAAAPRGSPAWRSSRRECNRVARGSGPPARVRATSYRLHFPSTHELGESAAMDSAASKVIGSSRGSSRWMTAVATRYAEPAIKNGIK